MNSVSINLKLSFDDSIGCHLLLNNFLAFNISITKSRFSILKIFYINIKE